MTGNPLPLAPPPSLREWRDGLLSSVMRTACSPESRERRWVVFDGPVDTQWVESLNTVLDDTKTLTLASGTYPAQGGGYGEVYRGVGRVRVPRRSHCTPRQRGSVWRELPPSPPRPPKTRASEE